MKQANHLFELRVFFDNLENWKTTPMEFWTNLAQKLCLGATKETFTPPKLVVFSTETVKVKHQEVGQFIKLFDTLTQNFFFETWWKSVITA